MRARTRRAFVIGALLMATLAGGGCDDPAGEPAPITRANYESIGLSTADRVFYASLLRVLTGLEADDSVEPAGAAVGAGIARFQPSTCASGTATRSADGALVDFDQCVVSACVIDGAMFRQHIEDEGRIEFYFDHLTIECQPTQKPANLHDAFLDCDDRGEQGFRCSASLPAYDGHLAPCCWPTQPQSLTIEGFVHESYDVSGTLVDGRGSRYRFETVYPIELDDCPGGVAAAGEIEIMGSETSDHASFEFERCERYRACIYDPAGSFAYCSGSWWADHLVYP